MIDFKLISDNDVGGTLESAFATMSAETIDVSRGIYLVNDLRITAALGMAKGAAFLDAVESSPLVPERVRSWLVGNGIDISHPDTQATLLAIGAPHTAEVIAMGYTPEPKYGPGFLIGHLANAREYVAADIAAAAAVIAKAEAKVIADAAAVLEQAATDAGQAAYQLAYDAVIAGGV